jgi:hypothetical protein
MAASNREHHDGEVVVASVRAGPENQVFVRVSRSPSGRPRAGCAGRLLFVSHSRARFDDPQQVPEKRKSRCNAGLRMARPGLEPGTPRFSVVDRHPSNSPETPAVSRLLACRAHARDRRKLRLFVADLGTRKHFGAQWPSDRRGSGARAPGRDPSSEPTARRPAGARRRARTPPAEASRGSAAEIAGPVNMTRMSEGPAVAELAELGVARVSWALYLYWEAMARFKEQLASLAE